MSVETTAARIALGAMNFGRRTPKAEAERILARAFERGVTFVDTANAYADGESERIVGAFLRGKRDRARVATKVGFGRIAGKPEGLGRARVLEAAEQSLARLGVDVIDVYYLHVPDPATPIDETLDAIADLFDKRRIRAFGVSNYASWQILDIMHRCDARAIPRPAMSQVLYNVLIRQLDIEYRAFTRAFPIHTSIYNPLAGGLLTGRHVRTGETVAGSRFDKNAMYRGRYWTDRYFDLVDDYAAIAREAGMSLLELAYGFVAGVDFVDSVILGPGTVEHLDQGIDALANPISAELRARVDACERAFLGTDARYAR